MQSNSDEVWPLCSVRAGADAGESGEGEGRHGARGSNPSVPTAGEKPDPKAKFQPLHRSTAGVTGNVAYFYKNNRSPERDRLPVTEPVSSF